MHINSLIYIYIYREREREREKVGAGKSDKMRKISWKVDKQNTDNGFSKEVFLK